METVKQNSNEEDVTKESVDQLIEHRIPWLALGFLGGLLTTLIVAKYEKILTADVRLAFFMPIIVYLSDAVGTQSQTIYVRELAERKNGFSFSKYIFKETMTGLGLGLISGIVLGMVTAFWLKSSAIGLAVGLTMIINLTIAPALAIFIPSILYKEHSDPALGSGPVATIIQDLISLLVYFFIASLIVF